MEKKKILLIKLGAIGDVVHSTIITSAIKNSHPDWEVHYLTSGTIAPILADVNHIDKVLAYKYDSIFEYFKLLRMIKNTHYDAIFCLTRTLKLFILSFFAYPKKIAIKKKSDKSWVEEYFQAAKSVFPDLELPSRLTLQNNKDEEASFVEKYLSKYRRPFIVINPGKRFNQLRQGRVWNIEKWDILIDDILKKYGGTVFVNGSKSERKYHMQLEKENVVVFSGQTKLKESCILLSQADIVISGDSGPIHIASAYNVKTLSLLGSTSPDKIKPYGENGYYIEPKSECKYCWKKKCKYVTKDDYAPCIESITTEDVMKKLELIRFGENKYGEVTLK